METITVISANKIINYKEMSNALFYFDAMLDGETLEIIQHSPMLYKEINTSNMKILTQLIGCQLGKRSPADIDSYITSTFDAFCNKRKEINLIYWRIDEQYEVIADTVFTSIKANEPMTVLPSQTNVNLFKPYIFDLFPNLESITMNVGSDPSLYGFSFWNFINISLMVNKIIK